MRTAYRMLGSPRLGRCTAGHPAARGPNHASADQVCCEGGSTGSRPNVVSTRSRDGPSGCSRSTRVLPIASRTLHHSPGEPAAAMPSVTNSVHTPADQRASAIRRDRVDIGIAAAVRLGRHRLVRFGTRPSALAELAGDTDVGARLATGGGSSGGLGANLGRNERVSAALRCWPIGTPPPSLWPRGQPEDAHSDPHPPRVRRRRDSSSTQAGTRDDTRGRGV